MGIRDRAIGSQESGLQSIKAETKVLDEALAMDRVRILRAHSS